MPVALWSRVSLEEATPALVLQAAAECLHDRAQAAWTAAFALHDGAARLVHSIGPVPEGLGDRGAALAPASPGEPVEGAMAIGLWPGGVATGALVVGARPGALPTPMVRALLEVRAEAETAWDLAWQAEELRRRAPSATELASLREGTLQRLWHELLTPVAILRAAWQQLDGLETDAKKRRPLRRIGNAVERLGHVFDLLNDILWAREDSRTRVSAAQLADGLIAQAGTQLLVELGNAGLLEDAAALRAAVLRLSDHARAMTPLIDEEPAPLSLEAAARGAVGAALSGAQREVEVTVTARGEESLPPQLLADALTALLKNAFASTPDGSRIEVRAARGQGGLSIEVEDHGVGMPEARLRAVMAGLDSARDPTWYTSGTPLAFGSGGAGLDLVRLQAVGRWRGWKFEAETRLCPHVDPDGRGCPGDARRCAKLDHPSSCARLPKGTLFRLITP